MTEQQQLKTIYTSTGIQPITVGEHEMERLREGFSSMVNNQRRHEIIVAAIESGKSARKALKIANHIMGERDV